MSLHRGIRCSARSRAGTPWCTALIENFSKSLSSQDRASSSANVALYRLRALGNMLTTTENRLADDSEWRIAERGEAVFSLGGEKTAVTSAEIISGPHRRLVWSFYIVDGRITARLFEAKLLQARAVLLQRARVAALVAVSASMDDPGNPAEEQLTRFLTASQSLPRYVDSLRIAESGPGV